MFQADLYRSCTGKHYVRQVELFSIDDCGPTVDLHCALCHAELVRTPSGYLCCPEGHGRLIEETDE